MHLTWYLLTRLLGEFLATAMFVSVGCMGCIAPGGNSSVALLQSSIHMAFVFATVMHCFGLVSGAHANPCVSLACCMMDFMKMNTAILYVAAQLAGAVLGYYLLSVIAPKDAAFDEPGLCMTTPNSNLTQEQIFAIEFLLTGVLVLGWCVIWNIRNAQQLDAIPIRMGLLVGACCLAGGNLTGASLNPAKALAPAIYHQNYDNIWLYISGQLAAALTIPLAWNSLHRLHTMENFRE